MACITLNYSGLLRNLAAPFLQFSADEIDDLLMFFRAAVLDPDRLSELEVDLFRHVHLAVVLQVFSISPGVGLRMALYLPWKRWSVLL